MKNLQPIQQFLETLTAQQKDFLLKYLSEKDELSNVTIVTGLWNIKRGDLDSGFSRSYEDYKKQFAELLKAPINMIIYVAKEDENFVWDHRNKHNTFVKTIELEEFNTWFEFFDKVNEIRLNPSWLSQAGWLADSPQAKLEYYNPLVMSKMFMLNDATIHNPFGSEYFYWIDAGIANTVHSGYFHYDRVFDNLSKYADTINKFLFISYPYEGGAEIHGFDRTAIARYCGTNYVNYVCRGGFFGGKKNLVNEVNSLYYNLLSKTLKEGLMGTEESIFTIIAHKNEDIIHRFEIDGNGLVWPFFEKLKHVDALIEETLQSQQIKLSSETAIVNLYVLGFNSPEQFEVLCDSIENCDQQLLLKTKKYLINNSTDISLFDAYDKLCEKYGFEEIHKDNLGICGGRQFIAEHFDETNADFYMFFEDDMLLNSEEDAGFCKNGFKKYVNNLLQTIVKIMIKHEFDFLKLSFSEFYGENSTQWSWYNVPQEIRSRDWPEYDKLPEIGLDPNAPKTKFNHVYIIDETPYITGEIYYSNWPQIVSRSGNKKMFLDTKWAHPFEQTWMSHIYQLTKQEELTSAVLLASPVNHNRFAHYSQEMRREN